MLIFLLFSDQILEGKKPLSEANCLRGGAPCGRKPDVRKTARLVSGMRDREIGRDVNGKTESFKDEF